MWIYIQSFFSLYDQRDLDLNLVSQPVLYEFQCALNCTSELFHEIDRLLDNQVTHLEDYTMGWEFDQLY